MFNLMVRKVDPAEGQSHVISVLLSPSQIVPIWCLLLHFTSISTHQYLFWNYFIGLKGFPVVIFLYITLIKECPWSWLTTATKDFVFDMHSRDPAESSYVLLIGFHRQQGYLIDKILIFIEVDIQISLPSTLKLAAGIIHKPTVSLHISLVLRCNII